MNLARITNCGPIVKQAREMVSEVGSRLPSRSSRFRPFKRERRLVRKGGFEPPRSCERQPLKLVRLPVPPLPRGTSGSSHFSGAAGGGVAGAGVAGAPGAGVAAGLGVGVGATGAGGGAARPPITELDPR